MTFSTSYCLCDTLMDPQNIYIYICVCVCVCIPRSVIILYFVQYRIHSHKIVAGTIDEYKSICMRYEPIVRLCVSGCCYV